MSATEPAKNTSDNLDLADVYGDGLRLTDGVEVLEEWSQAARQAELNSVHEALFAMLDRTVYTEFEVIDDNDYPDEFVVVVRENLAIRARLNDAGSFAVLFIGPPVDALAP